VFTRDKDFSRIARLTGLPLASAARTMTQRGSGVFALVMGFGMANYKNLFRKASLTLLDGLLLVLCAASLAYLSVPSLAKLALRWQCR